MKIGELFVELGMKGGEKLKDSLADTNKGMKDLSSKTLETQAHLMKLASLGVALGTTLEEVSRRGAEAGKSLELAHLFTGESVVTIQKMAKGLAISNDSAIQLANSMNQVFAHISAEGGGKYFGLLGIDLQKVVTLTQQMNALQKAARSDVYKNDPRLQALLNTALIETGNSPELIGQFRRPGPVFPPLSPLEYTTPAESKKAADISDKYTQLGNLLTTLETKLSVTFGSDLVQALTGFTHAALAFTNFVGKEEEKHPTLKKFIGEETANLGIATLGSIVGGILGSAFFGVGAIPGAAAGAGIAYGSAELYDAVKDFIAGVPEITKGKRPSEFAAEDLASTLSEQGRQQLMLTINQTLLPNTSGRKETRTSKQTIGFDSKGGEANQTYQQLQNNQ